MIKRLGLQTHVAFLYITQDDISHEMNHIPLQEGPPPLQFLGNLASVQTSHRSGRAKYLLRSTLAPPSS